jgi:hypothetical protein
MGINFLAFALEHYSVQLRIAHEKAYLMFVTDPQQEFPMPVGLATPGARYWREVNLPILRAWFLAMYLVEREDEQFYETVCVACDLDLVDGIEQHTHKNLVSLLCILPPWQSGLGQWTGRIVKSIWRSRVEGDHDQFVFQDPDGAEFCLSYGENLTAKTADRRLVIEIQGPSVGSQVMGEEDE